MLEKWTVQSIGDGYQYNDIGKKGWMAVVRPRALVRRRERCATG